MLKHLLKNEKLLLVLYYSGCGLILLPVLIILAFFSNLIITFLVSLGLGLLIGVLGGKIEYDMRYVYTRIGV
jgi:hypothetical protein